MSSFFAKLNPSRPDGSPRRNRRLPAAGFRQGHVPDVSEVAVVRDIQRDTAIVPEVDRQAMVAELFAAASRGEMHDVVHEVLPLVKPLWLTRSWKPARCSAESCSNPREARRTRSRDRRHQSSALAGGEQP
jgi:hypothetical protein